jgi:hypothetical protein
VFGGGDGVNGLERVLDDAWVLDLEEGSRSTSSQKGRVSSDLAVWFTPLREFSQSRYLMKLSRLADPGARLDARGVAVGNGLGLQRGSIMSFVSS